MQKFYGLLLGGIIGALVGFGADQALTTYVLRHSEDAVAIITTNALGAFLVVPLFIIVSGYISYRMAQRPGKTP